MTGRYGDPLALAARSRRQKKLIRFLYQIHSVRHTHARRLFCLPRDAFHNARPVKLPVNPRALRRKFIKILMAQRIGHPAAVRKSAPVGSLRQGHNLKIALFEFQGVYRV